MIHPSILSKNFIITEWPSPAAFLVNDRIHYSLRISVIIDFVQTVCIPQCVLNPTPKRGWTLSHLIRSYESATLRQPLQLLHYMPDNWWPIRGFNQRLYETPAAWHVWLDSLLQYVHKTGFSAACWQNSLSFCLRLTWWFRRDHRFAFQVTEWSVVCMRVRARACLCACEAYSPVVVTLLFSIPCCHMGPWCMWHLYLPMDVLSLSAPQHSACQSALPWTAWDHSCHRDPTMEKNNLPIFS